MTTASVLKLQNLEERHPGVTKSIAGALCEAASVCFDRHHLSPKDLVVKRNGSSILASASWETPSQRTKSAWANTTDTTESGAYGVALAAIEMTDGLVAISRAETRTGADYYLAPIDEAHEDLEKSLRLEVSGVDQSSPATLQGRLTQKISQCKKGDSALPAIAVVVGFSTLNVVTADVEQE